MAKKTYQVIVIGGGHNGLTTAAMLARKGRDVLVIERRPVLGGMAACEEFHPGYRSLGLLQDTACVWPSVVESLQLERYGLQRESQATPVFLPQLPGEGQGLLLHTDPEQAASEIAAFSADDALQYKAFRSWLHRVRPFVQRVFQQSPLPLLHAKTSDLWTLLKTGLTLRKLGTPLMMELLRALPMSASDWLQEWFRTDLLRAGLVAPALHGSFTGPRSPTSNAPLLLRECTAHTPIRGGGPALIDALVQCARHHKVDILTHTEVAQILLHGEHVRGVVTTAGDEILATTVISSCDPKRTLLQFLPPAYLPTSLEHHIQNYRMRGTTAQIHLALAQAPRFACRPEHPITLARIGGSLQSLEQAFDAVKYRQFSHQPILDVLVPTTNQPSLAPEGHHVMSVLVHFVPYHLQDGWTSTTKDLLTKTVIQTLAKYLPHLPDQIVAHETLTPVDLEQRYGLTNGHIFHGELGLDQLLVRPVPGCERYHTPIHGLFLCGSGSYGGAGITCGPGYLAAQHIS